LGFPERPVGVVHADGSRRGDQLDLISGLRVPLEEHAIVGRVAWPGGPVGHEHENLAVAQDVHEDG
jgi:hypothetical protein